MRRLVMVASLAFAAVDAHAAAMMCGGVGADARRSLEATQGANLALEFFIADHGAYVANVGVVVTPLRQTEPVIEGTATGPLCVLTLAPGRYRVEATYNGMKRSATAAVPASSARPAHVALGFPQTAADGDLGPKASPEEKMQAKQP